MLTYFGKRYDYPALATMALDLAQVAGAKAYEYTDGKSRGVRAVDIKTGSGLHYTVLPDRALDITSVEYKGVPLAYMAQPGIVSPYYYQAEGNEWLRSFTGGLMTTCGLSNVGDASMLNGVKYGQHGLISHIPAENINIEEEFDGTDYLISVKGRVRQVKAFVENTILQRTIKSFAGKNSIQVTDKIENRTAGKQPFMLLYHFNFGFPLLNENSGILIPHNRPASDNSPYLANPVEFGKNIEEVNTDTVLLKPVCDERNNAYFLVTNDRDNPELALLIRYNTEHLQNLLVWKYLYSGNHVVCIEPANCSVRGIAYEEHKGSLQYLEPFEKREINLEIKVLESREEILGWQKRLEGLR